VLDLHCPRTWRALSEGCVRDVPRSGVIILELLGRLKREPMTLRSHQ